MSDIAPPPDARTERIVPPGLDLVADPEPDAPPPDEPLDFLDPPLRADAIGRLGHYEVLNVIGRGGFGIVFRAFDDVLQRVVAVKVLSPRMAATSPARQRFLREARGYAAVRHENVVQVHGIAADPLPYLVMEFVPGESLEGLITRTGPLPAADVVRIGVQVARGLAAAHATGIVHRDVKPANVLIEAGPDRRAKLTDFGLARAADDASLTQSGMVAGTPLFMAPEQARGETVDHRADLFSLGSMLYTMATGRPPFRAPTSMAVLKRVCDDDPRPVRDVIPEVPAGLCAVIARLHAKDPAARIQTAAEAAELLAKSLTETPVRPASRWSEPRPAGPVSRRIGLIAAAAVGAALAVGAYLLIPGKQPAARTDPPPEPAAPPVALADLLASPDWEWGPPENLGPGVNTPNRELMAALTADERELVFVRDRKLWVARRASPDEPFSAAEPLPVAAGELVQSPTLTGDGLVLAFTVVPTGTKREEVWASTRASRAEPFGPGNRLPEPVNGAVWTVAPVLSADGLTLLATVPQRTSPAGDIVRFTRPTREAPFTSAGVLLSPVNSPGFDAAAWASDDGRVLAWVRMEKQPFECRFHVRTSAAEPFGPARAFAVPGVAGEVGRPWLSADGQRLYFHTRELADAGDLDLWVTRRVAKKE